MTIGTNDGRKTYPGNGVTDTFDGPRSFTAGEVVVYLVDDATNVGVLQTAYTISGVGGTNTVIVMDTPPPADYTLLILHVPTFGQSTDITNLGRFLPEIIENALDKLAQQNNYLKDQSDRSLKMPTYVELSSYELPVPAAGYFLRWNSGGTALENAITISIEGITVSAYIETFLTTSTDGATAAANLGFGDMALFNANNIETDMRLIGGQIFYFDGDPTDFTIMANGVTVPTGTIQNLDALRAGKETNRLLCIDDTSGQSFTGDKFSWWHKLGTSARRCVHLVTSLTAGSSNFFFDGNIQRTIGTGGATVAYDVGLLDCPLIETNSAYSLVITDRGVGRKKTNATAYNWTIEKTTLGASYDFPEGSIVPLLNIGTAGTVTIVQGVDVILKLAGSALTGNRTLPINAQGYAWLVDKATNTWIIGGPGVG